MKGPSECVVDGGTMKRTVIFSSKICDNVDIEVGKFIRMYPPWYVLYTLSFDSVVSALFNIISRYYFSYLHDVH